MKTTLLTVSIVLMVSLGFSEDFKTLGGKEYKDANVARVEPDGIVLRTKTAFQHIGILSLEFHVDKLSRPLL